MSPMIEISAVTKKFGNFTAVDNISFQVNPGEIFAFLGVNGAGKTTTIRMLAGVLRPTTGIIKIGGYDILTQPNEAKQITGYIPDRPYIYNKLTGREFLYFVADLYNVPNKLVDQRIDEMLGAYSLSDWQDDLVESYSHGMRQRLATCSALLHKPKLLIVDEPMVGLDPHGARTLKIALKGYAKAGMSIFLSTHSLNVAEELADRLAIIQNGKIISVGTLSEIKASSGDFQGGLESLFLQLTSDKEEAVNGHAK